MNSDLYTCSANGWIKVFFFDAFFFRYQKLSQLQRWSRSFDCTSSWQAHEGIVLSSIITKRDGSAEGAFRLVTGGNDNYIKVSYISVLQSSPSSALRKVWEVIPPKEHLEVPLYTLGSEIDTTSNIGSSTPSFPIRSAIELSSTSDTMTYALSKFVSIPSISSCPTHAEDCRQAAIWLRKCLGQLGARTTLVSHDLSFVYPSLNIARFSCQQEKVKILLSWGLSAGPKVIVRNPEYSSTGKIPHPPLISIFLTVIYV